MPYCPSCKYEYVDGIERCPDCDVELIEELPPDTEEELVPVYYVQDENEAIIIRDLLESSGIPVAARTDETRELDIFSGPMGEEAIVVPVSYSERAREVINEALEAGKELPETGESLSPEEESLLEIDEESI